MESLEAISNFDRDVIVANIKDRFKCLYYSYRNKVLGESKEAMTVDPNKLLEPDDGLNICGSTCISSLNNCNQFLANCCYAWIYEFPNKPLFETVKEDNIQGGLGHPFWAPPAYFFDYKFPAKLPSPVDRFKKGWVFDYDIHLSLDTTAENLVIAVFD